jgi:hypothetical protein
MRAAQDHFSPDRRVLARWTRSCLCALALAACAEHPLAELDAAAPRSDGGDASTPAAGNPDAAMLLPQDATVLPALDAQPPPQDAGGELASDASALDAQLDAHAPSSAARASIALPEHWVVLDAGADPFDDRPALVDCRPGGVTAETLSEERVLGVETGSCAYLTAQQATRRAVAAGEVVKVRLWHFELSAPEPAEAHAVVEVDGLRVLDERIPIPMPGALIVRELRVERDIPAGAPIYFHLHNHGANSWALVEVSAGPA